MLDDEDHMLTTIDNPWNPYVNYDEWLQFDNSMGYNSNGLLARIAKTSFDLSDADNDAAIEDAIDTIVTENVSGVHTKATRPNIAVISSS